MNIVEPIRNVDDIERLKDYLKNWNERNYVLCMFGLYSGLRISDIVSLQVRDVMDERSEIQERKTKKKKRFAINPALRKALRDYIANNGLKPYDFLFPSKKKVNRQTGERFDHIGRGAAYLIFKKAAQAVGLKNIGTHSMRKTFGYHFYVQTGDVVKLMKIFNHSSPEITLIYIGFQQDELDDALLNFSY